MYKLCSTNINFKIKSNISQHTFYDLHPTDDQLFQQIYKNNTKYLFRIENLLLFSSQNLLRETNYPEETNFKYSQFDLSSVFLILLYSYSCIKPWRLCYTCVVYTYSMCICKMYMYEYMCVIGNKSSDALLYCCFLSRQVKLQRFRDLKKNPPRHIRQVENLFFQRIVKQAWNI